MDAKNPIGIKSIDHLEFAVSDLNSPTLKTFEDMGFQSTSRNENQILYTQGQVRFLADNTPDSLASKYVKDHGEGVSKISFWVDNAEKSLETAVSRGAKEVSNVQVQETEHGLIKTTSIQGFGDVVNEFVERPSQIFRSNIPLNSNPSGQPLKTRVSRIDHLTNNVPKGEMDHWVEFYKEVYGFVETRYFDIKGEKTGLNSKVVQLANNQVIIPINEPEKEGGQSQIQEFLDRHNGSGVQHIALMTPDIVSTISELRSRDLNFLKIPSTYYQDIPGRNLGVTEDLKILEDNQILVDGDSDGYLLQIFSETYVGPLFFEYIQRKGHWGFGEGNFQALFDAIERDQIERGYLKN